MGSSEGQTYCLRWNNHKSNLVEILDALIKMESYVDCTIVVDDQVQFKAHRVVLAANSPYFQSILQDVPMDHCSILFPGVQAFEMRALLEYMYTGEVNVTQSQIPKIMKIAEQLEVKGLFDMTDLKAKFNKYDEQTTTTATTTSSSSSSSTTTTTNHHHHNYPSSQQLQSTHHTTTTSSSSSIFSNNNNTEQSGSSTRNNDDNRHIHSNIVGGGGSSGDSQHQQQKSVELPHHHHHQQQQQQSSPVITTSTNITTSAQSSSASPPYTYKSPYSSLYTKSPGPSTSDRQHWPSISPSSVIPNVSIPTTAAAAAMLSSVYESAADMNPLKRKKLSSISSMLMSRDTPILRNVLAQTHAADSSQPMPLVCQSLKQERSEKNTSSSVASDYSSNERKYKHDEPHSPYTDKSFEDDGLDCEPKYLGDSRSFSQQSNSQKPEWKRYKQYTRSDILAAIECVRNGMSALQASRKFGVPSRTLYDKVKKLGITTGRPMNRTIKRSPSSGSSPASFPFGLSGTNNPYGQSSESILSQIHDSNEHHHHHHHHRDKDRGEHHHIPSNIPHPAAAALLDPAFLQQAFESRGGDIAGREALHAMALAAAAHAAVNGISTSPGTNGTARSPSPGFAMKYSRSQSTPPPPPSSSSQLTRERERDFMEREIERERERELDEEYDREHAQREHDDRDRNELDHETEEDENHVEDLSVSRKETQSPSLSHRSPTRPPSNHHSYGTTSIQQSSGSVIVPPMTKSSPNGGEEFNKTNIELKREILTTTDDSRENN